MTEGEKQKQLLDREVRDRISVLALRLGLADLHCVQKPHGRGSICHDNYEEDDDNNDQAENQADDDYGIRIIMPAGSNFVATMRSRGRHSLKPIVNRLCQGDDLPGQGHEWSTAFVDGNFQAINNSLMLGGSIPKNEDHS